MATYTLYKSLVHKKDDLGAVLAVRSDMEHVPAIKGTTLGQWQGITAGDAVCEWIRETKPEAMGISVHSECIAEGYFMVGYSWSWRSQW